MSEENNNTNLMKWKTRSINLMLELLKAAHLQCSSDSWQTVSIWSEVMKMWSLAIKRKQLERKNLICCLLFYILW